MIQNGIGSDYGHTVTIDGGDNDDTIQAHGGSINGGYGNDRISLSGNVYYNTINGGYGYDAIYGYSWSSYGVLYQYNSGDGYDTIYNWNSTDTLSLGSGIYYTRTTPSGSSNVLISIQGGGAVTLSGASSKSVNIVGGNLVSNINNTVSGKTVYGNYYNDTISNSGSDVKIYGYGGNDSISNTTGNRVTMDGGYGYDRISLSGNVYYNTINGGYGYDAIYGYSWSSYGVLYQYNSGTGYDSIIVENAYAYVTTIDGGDNDDTIQAHGGSINGGYGNDRISLSGNVYYNTINGGYGNDILYSDTSGNGVLYQYNTGEGYDTIYNWNSSDTLSLGSGIYYTRTTPSGSSNVLISIQGGGAVTLSGASSKTVNIKGGTLITPSVVLNNYNQNSVVSGSSGADTIRNYAGGAKIYGLAGLDTIYNSTDSSYKVNGGYGYVSIDAGAGNDNIYSYDPRVSINAGAGADKITLNGNCYDITVIGGAGLHRRFKNQRRFVQLQFRRRHRLH